MSNEAAKNFANEWFKLGNESSDYQDFWRELLRDVFGVQKTKGFIKFIEPVENTLWKMDAYIPSTKVLIEHKSFGKNLTEKFQQSDGKFLTPFEQAKRYANALPENKKPRWIVTCNFDEFRIYNPSKNNFETNPTIIKLRDLRYQYRRLRFLVDETADDSPPEEKISKDAAKIVEKICLAVDKNYLKQKPTFRDLLSKLCTRLVFCFYADDADIFHDKKFGDWFRNVSTGNFVDALQEFFKVLGTPDNERQNLDDELKKFPYVNGGLFDEKFDLPPLNKEFESEVRYAHNLRNSRGKFQTDAQNNLITFSWREISPPIFGAMFESLLNPNEDLKGELRYDRQRKGGIYYTSEDNIEKLIKPLFLDDLHEEFAVIKRKRNDKIRLLQNFQDKIAALRFLDPACGSGNFLTKTYLELRRLENEILEELRGLNVTLPDNPVKVSIKQFFGIEIDSFAVAVAQVALWIAEIQMLQETEGALGKDFKYLPLKNNPAIVCANALRVDWKEIFGEHAPAKFDYIIGNPPFIGYSLQTDEQKADMRRLFPDNPKVGKLDYVSAWYQKASEFINGTEIRCAFVSTNSIVQGEQVAYLWKDIFDAGIHIDFAHRTFRWLSDSENMAHVHCVIVGFSKAHNSKPKKIFDGDNFTFANNINAYLVDGENIFLESRRKHFQSDVPKIQNGNRPADGQALIIEADDYETFITNEPDAKKYIKRLIGSDEFIDGKPRYCLWLVDTTLDEIKKFPLIAERVELCKQNRLKGADDRKKLAAKPHLFRETRNPERCFVVPVISSDRRYYVPMGFIDKNTIANNLVQIIPDAQIYHFGILTSSIHMAWMRTTCGRLKSDYRYSAQVVYNNFPWRQVTARQKRMIEKSAQEILDVRKEFPDWTFAKLYNEDTMPDELRWAHKSNDYAVALAYGFEKFLDDEAKIVAELMKLYKRLTKN